MKNPSDPDRMRELGRAGGKASGEARRRRRERDVGIVAWDVLNADPEPVVRRVYESGNGVAIVDMIRFATEAKTAQLRSRERELDEQERGLRQRESDVSQREALIESWPEWLEMTNTESVRIESEVRRIEAEVVELERQRDALRDAIAREAEEHDMEPVYEEDEDALAQA